MQQGALLERPIITEISLPEPDPMPASGGSGGPNSRPPRRYARGDGNLEGGGVLEPAKWTTRVLEVAAFILGRPLRPLPKEAQRHLSNHPDLDKQ